MGTRKGWGSRELGLTILLNEAKQVLEVRQSGRYAGRCKGLFLEDDSDHRRM